MRAQIFTMHEEVIVLNTDEIFYEVTYDQFLQQTEPEVSNKSEEKTEIEAAT